MNQRKVVYVDPEGRKHARLIPEHAPDSHARMGIELGPPCLDSLGLPTALEIALHNQLYDRALLTASDVRRNPNAVAAAVQAAYKVTAQRVMAIYELQDRGILPADAEGEGKP